MDESSESYFIVMWIHIYLSKLRAMVYHLIPKDITALTRPLRKVSVFRPRNRDLKVKDFKAFRNFFHYFLSGRPVVINSEPLL